LCERYQGLILDGRNRLLACEKAGKEPIFDEGDEDSAQNLVDSLNVQRRDMSNAQRALVAARRLLREEKSRGGNHKSKVGQRPTLKTRDEIAKRSKTGSKSIQQARCLLEYAPDLAAQVDHHGMTLAAAYAHDGEWIRY
jgi:hypothetical protein